MPPPTDHPARRAELVDLAADLIAREGLEAATIRRLAELAGYSTTIVTHYFASKHALLLDVYEACAQRAQARVDAVLARDPGDLQGCLEALLPIGDEARAGWRVNFAFWQRALHDPEFAEKQRWWTRRAEETVAAVIAARPGAKEDGLLARYLVTLIEGIAVRTAFDPRWSDTAQREFLRHELALHRI